MKELLTNYFNVATALSVLGVVLYYIKKRYYQSILKYVISTDNKLDDVIFDAVCLVEVLLNGKGGFFKFNGAKALVLKTFIDNNIKIPNDNILDEMIEKNHKKLEKKLNEIKGDKENENIKMDKRQDSFNDKKNNCINENDNNKNMATDNKNISNDNKNKYQNIPNDKKSISENIQKEQIKSNEKVAINKADNDLLRDVLKINENLTKTSMWANVAIKNKGFKLENTDIVGTVGVKWFPK